MVTTKRVYAPYETADGFRVLIDRLWPRGLSKANAHVDLWAKAVAPSNELRKWYGHDPAKWSEFRQRYARELRSEPAKTAFEDLVRRARSGRLTLLYSSRVEDVNNATALLEFLETRLSRAT